MLESSAQSLYSPGQTVMLKKNLLREQANGFTTDNHA